MGNEPETLRKADEEYSEDPHCSTKTNATQLDCDSCPSLTSTGTVIKIIGSSSEDGNTLSASLMLKSELQKAALFSFPANISSTFKNFLRVPSVVLETTTHNDHVYHIMDKIDLAVSYKVPQRPMDHCTKYGGQAILIMEDSAAVVIAARFLYEKHPSISSLYILENQTPKLVKGDPVPLSADSRLVLVGHGKKGSDEIMRLGGYKAEEVAEIITRFEKEGKEIKTTSLVVCEVWSDEAFKGILLKELHARLIETEPHIRSSLVQVTRSGQTSCPEAVTQIQSGNTEAFISKNHVEDSWPTQPHRFVSQGSRQDHTDDLEALAWAFFQRRKDNPSVHLKRPLHSNNDHYAIYDLQLEFHGNTYIRKETRWFVSNLIPQNSNDKNDVDSIADILNKCYEINSGGDILNVIAHFAYVGEAPVYLMLNDWIYKVFPKRLYVFPVGKKLNRDQTVDQIKGIIEGQFDKHKYADIRDGIEKSCEGLDRYNMYAQYARQTLQGIYEKGSLDPTIEAWFSTFFLASVISESSRNFRSFPIMLMLIDIHNMDSSNTKISKQDFNLLEKHPMTKGGTWINTDKRGYLGSSTEVPKKKPKLKSLIEEEEGIVKAWLTMHAKTDTDKVDAEMLKRLLELVCGRNVNPSLLEEFKKSYKYFKKQIVTSGMLAGSHDGLPIVHSHTDSIPKLSSYYSRSSAIPANHTHRELQDRYPGNIQDLHVKPRVLRNFATNKALTAIPLVGTRLAIYDIYDIKGQGGKYVCILCYTALEAEPGCVL